MKEEILNLAKECRLIGQNDWLVEGSNIEAFYKAAFNSGLEAAVECVSNSDDQLMGEFHIERIRRLEMK